MAPEKKIITCGCRFNRHESAEMLERLGETGEDMIVVNTCAVTKKSEAKSKHAIRRAVDDNPGALIVAAGCLAELSPDSLRSIKGVGLVLGNEEKFNLIRPVQEPATSHTGGVRRAAKFLELTAGRPENRSAAYLKVQNGCDETCSFCVVRVVRGKSRSARPEFVVKRAWELIREGAREIVLTGINLGRYGLDLPDKTDLASLIRLLPLTGGARFRLSSVNPTDVTDDLVGLMARTPSVCRHLHIPMQSGSDRILNLMERSHTSAQYAEAVEKAARAMPGLSIGCDVMAGFPGESEEDFKQSMRLLEELPFSYAHVFQYSPRPQTKAGAMRDSVPSSVKKERTAGLKEIAARKSLAFRRSLVGKEVEILVEAGGPKGWCRGKSDTFVQVEFQGERRPNGALASVLVEVITDSGVAGSVTRA